MHIPDGFVSDPMNAVMGVVAAVSLGYCVWSIQKDTETKAFQLPLFAVVSAFIFAAQMLNFSIGGGTSGHFLGAAFAAALLGPWGACLSMALVLGVQAFFFGDGGITALGANIVNMGVIGGILSSPVFRALSHRVGTMAALGATSWLSVVLASSLCAVELALSGTSPLSVALPAMAGTHALIGLGEAAISVAAVALLTRAFPSVCLARKGAYSFDAARLVAAGIVLSLLLATVASPFASSSPDGLEKVAEEKGFLSAANEEAVVWRHSPFADYQVALVGDEGLSTSLAGFVGVLLVSAFAFGSGRLMVGSKRL